MSKETIHHGTALCGHVGQIFKTGKCAHCYIAELEALVEEAKHGCDKITEALGPDTGTLKGGRVYDCERQRCEWPMCECKAKPA